MSSQVPDVIVNASDLLNMKAKYWCPKIARQKLYTISMMASWTPRANHVCTICLKHLDIPRVELSALSDHFTEAEVWSMIKSWPPDKASGPDGFSARFLQAAWHIIHPDLMRAFDTFWWLDM
jgi:hypothetical protein